MGSPTGEGAPDAAELLRRQLSRRRAHRHGACGAARYTNVGYLAAGEVIGAASRESYRSYVQRVVLEPAGMSRTGFSYLPGADAATGYVRAPRAADPLLRGVLPAGIVGARHGQHVALNRFHVDGPAYGGLVGDVVDAGKFLRLHLGDGELDGRRVLSPATTRAMREVNRAGKPFDHGLGWFRRHTTAAGDWVEHFGAGAGFWNVMRLYPERGLGVVVMTNSTTSYDFDQLFEVLADPS